jgi:hypothetical protein
MIEESTQTRLKITSLQSIQIRLILITKSAGLRPAKIANTYYRIYAVNWAKKKVVEERPKSPKFDFWERKFESWGQKIISAVLSKVLLLFKRRFTFKIFIFTKQFLAVKSTKCICKQVGRNTAFQRTKSCLLKQNKDESTWLQKARLKVGFFLPHNTLIIYYANTGIIGIVILDDQCIVVGDKAQWQSKS